jgi:hypothetical protein
MSLIAATPTPALRADPPHKGEGEESHSTAFCLFFFGPALLRAGSGVKNHRSSFNQLSGKTTAEF